MATVKLAANYIAATVPSPIISGQAGRERSARTLRSTNDFKKLWVGD